jgi:hypothetical protein
VTGSPVDRYRPPLRRPVDHHRPVDRSTGRPVQVDRSTGDHHRDHRPVDRTVDLIRCSKKV